MSHTPDKIKAYGGFRHNKLEDLYIKEILLDNSNYVVCPIRIIEQRTNVL